MFNSYAAMGIALDTFAFNQENRLSRPFRKFVFITFARGMHDTHR
jgi:hypothetical protein